jgi:membrane protease YdiL (CAAX protease family)
LYAPIIAALLTDREFKSTGLGAPDWKKAAADLLLFSGLILPIFLFGWWALFHYGFGKRFVASLPDELTALVLWQLVGIALPEEVFFRGFLQDRLNRILGRSWRIPGARVGPGLFLSAAVFALAHYVVSPQPVRLLVFFPGLLFGYFRERSGSVFVPVLAHALANVTFLTLQFWAV